MSHIVSSKVVIADLACLKQAIQKFQALRWIDKKTYSWYGTFMNDYHGDDAAYKDGVDPKDYGKCEAALHVDGSDYEIGIMKRKDGKGYAIVWDFYGTGREINKVVGDGAEKLLVEYQKEFISRFANTEGLNLTMEETGEEITMELELGV